ncbi:hypothetical protein C8J57DRAFT_1492139 [Mycena rebaudengoi]|nr:hypothetical protein C8J57DRAFT_1492139 [Mycena rebaudengoi]
MLQRARVCRLAIPHPLSTDADRTPLDDVIGTQVTTASLWRSSWPTLPAARPPAALAFLRDHDGPPSRLVLHAAAHAFLRAADAPRAALLLLTLAAKPAPRLHSLKLNTALDALLTQVPRAM